MATVAGTPALFTNARNPARSSAVSSIPSDNTTT
jgi:hypothetical protein